MRTLATSLLSLVIGAQLPAQVESVAGTVRGFDGEPVAGAVVSVLTQTADISGHAVLSRRDGSFVLAPRSGFEKVRVQLEGVALEMRAPASGMMRVSFQKVRHFAVRGHVVTPDGSPARGVDLAFRRGKEDTIATVTTDARGAFLARFGEPVHDVLVDPLGWRHVVRGPFEFERGLAVDLRLERDRYRCVSGRVLGPDGAPVAGALVEALDDQLEPTGLRTRADADGSYALWSPKDVAAVRARDGAPLALQVGPWKEDREVALDARAYGFTMLIGRVLDADGEGVVGAPIYTLAAAGPPPDEARAATWTGSGGWFRVEVPSALRFAWTRGRRGKGAGLELDHGADAPLELRLK